MFLINKTKERFDDMWVREIEIWKEHENKPNLKIKDFKRELQELKNRKKKRIISEETFLEHQSLLIKESTPPLKELDNKVVKLVVSHYEDGQLAYTWHIIKGWECYQVSKSKSGKSDIVFPESRHAKVEGFTPFNLFHKDGNVNQGTRYESSPDEVLLKLRYFDNGRDGLAQLHQVKPF